LYFSGCCCDTRTATIVVNAISLGFAGLGLVSLAPQMDRPGFERFGAMMAAFVIGIVCNVLGLYGALKFKKTFVMVAAVWFGIEAILSIVLFMDFVGAAIAVCFLYPHIMLFRDMHRGIITPETFPNEKDCCGSCC
jgi:Flp pilus assembly protein protease CpaA